MIFLQAKEQTLLFVRPETADIEQKKYDEEVKQAKVYLDGLKGVFREKGIKARAFITQAPVVEAIIKAAERENADLIALASHDRTGFYGSVATGILHRIDRPLLLIRSD